MNQTAVHLQLLFTRSSRTDTAAQTGQGTAQSDQARCAVTQLCQLNLDFSLARRRMRRENIENDHRPVHYLRIQRRFQIAKLCRGQFIVADHAGCAHFPDHLPQFPDLSTAQIGAWMNLLPVLHQTPDRRRPGSIRQFFQLIQGRLRIIFIRGADRHQNDALLQFFHIEQFCHITSNIYRLSRKRISFCTSGVSAPAAWHSLNCSSAFAKSPSFS